MSDNVRENNRLFEVQLPREHLWSGGGAAVNWKIFHKVTEKASAANNGEYIYIYSSTVENSSTYLKQSKEGTSPI